MLLSYGKKRRRVYEHVLVLMYNRIHARKKPKAGEAFKHMSPRLMCTLHNFQVVSKLCTFQVVSKCKVVRTALDIFQISFKFVLPRAVLTSVHWTNRIPQVYSNTRSYIPVQQVVP